MNVIDLAPGYRTPYLACLKTWDAVPELMAQKGRWHDRRVARGLRVKLTVDDAGRPPA